MENDFFYDVALSFAGEDREYVEQVANQLRSHGVRVFYDKFEETKLWGKNLFEYLNEVYKTKARFTVMFISKHYKDKLWTNHERRSMQERAFSESSEYILPVRFDDTEIPGLHSTISYLSLREKSPFDLAKIIYNKIGWVIKNRWWGEWNIESIVDAYSGQLEIRRVVHDHFQFSLTVIKGAHSGQVEGLAYFSSTNEAICVKDTGYDEKCRLKFFKTNEVLQVYESPGCQYFHGVRAFFSGDYKLKKDVFYRFDFMNDNVLTKVYDLLKEESWTRFLACFADLYYDESINEADRKVISGGVPGLYTIMQAILIVDKHESVWGAFIQEGRVYYFTSVDECKMSLPEEIESWRENFMEREIIYLK